MDFETPPKRTRYNPHTILDTSQFSDDETVIEPQQRMSNTYNNYMLMRKPKYPSKYFGYRAVIRDKDTFDRYGPSWGLSNAQQRENRLTDSYMGRGAYKRRRSSYKPVKMYMKGKGMYLGNSFSGQGNYFKRMMRRQMHRTMAGQTPLGALGKKLGRRALGMAENVISGQGEYDLNDSAPESNNLVAGGGLSVPSFSTQSDETGSLTIQHSEYVKDIYGVPWDLSGSDPVVLEPFKNDSIALNPGIASSFPWLSQIAANYEEYEMLQLMFCFKTRIGDNLTTTDGQVGTLLMFTDYNPSDHPRRTKQDMLQGYGTSVSKISDSDILHGIECDPSKIKGDAHKFVRTGGTSQELHDFDWGLFQIAVDNTPAVLSNKVIGELYVSYTVKLSKPRLYAQLGNAIQQDQVLMRQTRPTGASQNAVIALAASGVSNSIGCKFQGIDLSNLNKNSIDVTLPGGFSGPFEVVVLGDMALGAATAVRLQTTTLQGNVTLKDDILSSHLGTDDSDPGAGQDADNNYVNPDRIVAIYHLETTMAAFGKDNKFTIDVFCNSGTSEQDIKWSLLVRRYNSLDRAGADEFVTPAGGKYLIDSN